MTDGSLGLTVLALAFLASAGLTLLLRPLFRRYAVALPNARSSHVAPTPQGGGLAVVLAVAIALGAAAFMMEEERAAFAGLLPVGAAVVLLTAVGGIDDVCGIPALPRLVLQVVAITAAMASAPGELRAVPFVPVAVERSFEIFAGLWFVNLFNFMDGIDLMAVTETSAITAGISLFSLFGAVAPIAGVTALALFGAVLGFAPFNRPVAKLFLGDVGSLPIGLGLFWLLLQLAGSGHLAAALLLPLYYLADATVTLLWRIGRRENILSAHRSHFYQVAAARGLRVSAIVGMVFTVNVVLIGLATVTLAVPSLFAGVAMLALGGAAVAVLLARFARGKAR
jgi:UDP-N-acetylmuramyl pentapeptide phosphotransferase/UDP-N-acetylglucosamine-1-phosphate transferase